MTLARHSAAVGLIAAVAAGANLLNPISSYDGGLVPSAATFILHGSIPYRDFWWLYGPGAPLIFSGITAILGPSILLVRVIGALLIGTQAAVGYRILRPDLPHPAAALMVIGAAGTVAFVVGVDVTSWSVAMTLAVAGLTARVMSSDRGFAAGCLVGLAFAARFDVGAYALLAALVVPDRKRLVAGFALIAVPIVACLVLVAPLRELFEQVVWYPIVGPRQFRNLPPPQVVNAVAFVVVGVVVILPKLSIAVAAIGLWLGHNRSRPTFVLATFAGLCQLQTFGRADIYHQAQAAFPALLLLALISAPLVRRVSDPIPRRRAVLRLTGFALAASATAWMLVVASFGVTNMQLGTLSPDDAALIAGIRTLQANTTRDEPVFVGLTSNRITLVNDMLIYYLADRGNGVRVAMFNPGVTNTDPVQSGMARDLATSRTEVMVLNDRWAERSEPSNASSVPGSSVLDDYIADHYRVVCDYGSIRVLATPERAPRIICATVDRDERLFDILGPISPQERQ